VPENIGLLKNLIELKLHNNPLQKYPNFISNLTNLEVLTIRNIRKIKK